MRSPNCFSILVEKDWCPFINCISCHVTMNPIVPESQNPINSKLCGRVVFNIEVNGNPES